ncbi:hypothetical protein C8F01DRAFT_1079448 [Mycena amicta]|nr:hypothetical protein C8F01DRAFT_1079448 [Mycena amicta]
MVDLTLEDWAASFHAEGNVSKNRRAEFAYEFAVEYLSATTSLPMSHIFRPYCNDCSQVYNVPAVTTPGLMGGIVRAAFLDIQLGPTAKQFNGTTSSTSDNGPYLSDLGDKAQDAPQEDDRDTGPDLLVIYTALLVHLLKSQGPEFTHTLVQKFIAQYMAEQGTVGDAKRAEWLGSKEHRMLTMLAQSCPPMSLTPALSFFMPASITSTPKSLFYLEPVSPSPAHLCSPHNTVAYQCQPSIGLVYGSGVTSVTSNPKKEKFADGQQK